MELLAERGIDVSQRTVLRWVQTFGPLLAAEVRKHRRSGYSTTAMVFSAAFWSAVCSANV